MQTVTMWTRICAPRNGGCVHADTVGDHFSLEMELQPRKSDEFRGDDGDFEQWLIVTNGWALSSCFRNKDDDNEVLSYMPDAFKAVLEAVHEHEDDVWDMLL